MRVDSNSLNLISSESPIYYCSIAGLVAEQHVNLRSKSLRTYDNSMESGCFPTSNVSNTVIEENLRNQNKSLFLNPKMFKLATNSFQVT